MPQAEGGGAAPATHRTAVSHLPPLGGGRCRRQRGDPPRLPAPAPPSPLSPVRGEMPQAEGGGAAPASHRTALSTPPEETCP